MWGSVVLVTSLVAAVSWFWSNLVVVNWNKVRLGIERIEVSVPNLPDELDGVRLAQLSDIHVDPSMSERFRYITDEFLQQTINVINHEQPALLLLTGDYIVHDKEAIHHLVPFLKTVKMPTYAVLGNHDNYDSPAYCRQVLEQDAGVKVLENETAFPLGPGLALVGVGDPWSGRFHPERALSSLNETTPRLVLSHQPDTFEPLSEYRCDLVLSGHTHGGQVRLPVVGAVLPWIARVVRTILPKHIVSKYWILRLTRVHKHWEWVAGRHTLPNKTGGTNTLYINRGLGSATGIRFNCDPELTFITLRKSTTDSVQRT